MCGHLGSNEPHSSRHLPKNPLKDIWPTPPGESNSSKLPCSDILLHRKEVALH